MVFCQQLLVMEWEEAVDYRRIFKCKYFDHVFAFCRGALTGVFKSQAPIRKHATGSQYIVLRNLSPTKAAWTTHCSLPQLAPKCCSYKKWVNVILETSWCKAISRHSVDYKVMHHYGNFLVLFFNLLTLFQDNRRPIITFVIRMNGRGKHIIFCDKTYSYFTIA